MFFEPNANSHSSKKNFYSVLGVGEETTESEIKSAYRKLSLKYHPDRNKSPDAQSKFQEINEAYETLSDPLKKEQYDFERSGTGNDLFNMMFGGGGPFGHKIIFQHHGSAGPSPFGNQINIEELFHQMNNIHNINQRKPELIDKNVTVSIEQAFHGCNIPIEIERVIVRNGQQIKETETIYVSIPQGIDHQERVVIPEKGHCIDDVHKGDIRLNIHITNSSPFQRQGLDLIYKKTITLKEALLGFAFDLQHINGQFFNFSNVNQIIRPGFKKKLPNLGMIRENNTGNLWIEFDVLFPESLTENQFAVLKDTL